MRHARNQDGMTVAELVVVVAIFAIVSVLILNFLDQTTSVTGRIDSTVQAEKDAQVAVREFTEELRGASVIVKCPLASWAAGTHVGWPTDFGNCLTFSVSRNVSGFNPVPGACPKSVFAYALVGGTLRVDRDDYSATCVSTARYRERVVLDKIVNTASQPLLTYYDSTNATIDTVANPALVPEAESVQVHLLVRHRKNTPDLEFRTTVGLRNNNNR